MTKKRGRRPLPDAERKDRLVQARVPEDLDATLRTEARRRRLSVSQLIRNVLEDTFDLVDDVVSEAQRLGQTVRRDARRIADSAQGRRREAPEPAADSVFAWQEVVLNREQTCMRCGRTMRRGAHAMFGLADGASSPRLWLCPPCAAT